ncbi:lipoyltransferase [Tolypothrix sp. PCC 7601]|nr:lipoyltransferase [Tolypothrix sp. PCC 7601]
MLGDRADYMTEIWDFGCMRTSIPLTLQQSKGTGIPSWWLPNYHPLIFIFGKSKQEQNPWSAAKWLKLLS